MSHIQNGIPNHISNPPTSEIASYLAISQKKKKKKL